MQVCRIWRTVSDKIRARPGECTGFGGSSRAGLGAFGGLLLGLAESIAFAVEVDDFGAMDEAVDKSDDTGGGGEHLGPFGEGFIGREDGHGEVPACDDLEEEVGVAVVVVEVHDLPLRSSGARLDQGVFGACCRQHWRGHSGPEASRASGVRVTVPKTLRADGGGPPRRPTVTGITISGILSLPARLRSATPDP